MVDHIWKKGKGDPKAIYGASEQWEHCVSCKVRKYKWLDEILYTLHSDQFDSTIEPPCKPSLHHLAQAYQEKQDG